MTKTYGPMRVISKDGDHVADIPGGVETALRSWYAMTDRSANGRAGDELQAIHAKGLWIACNCRNSTEKPPILVPVMHERMTGKMTLRRQVDKADDDRPNHASDCEFLADFDRLETLEREQRQRQMRKRAMGMSWAIPADPIKATAFLLREEHAHRDPGPSGGRQSTLAGELWRIMWAARTEYLEKAVGSTMIAEMRKIIDGIARIPHNAFGDLSEITTTYPKDVIAGSPWLAKVAALKGWPSTSKPTGYLCILADKVGDGVVETPGLGPIHVEHRIGQPSQNGQPIKGPHLVMIACDVSKGVARPHIAYAQPVASRDCLAPVDSDFERKLCLGGVAALKTLMTERPDLTIRLRKEASSREVEVEPGVFQLCKPDFVCQVEGKRGKAKFVIEAMGYDDEAYHASKAVTHPLMALIGPVETIAYKDVATIEQATAAMRELILRHAP